MEPLRLEALRRPEERTCSAEELVKDPAFLSHVKETRTVWTEAIEEQREDVAADIAGKETFSELEVAKYKSDTGLHVFFSVTVSLTYPRHLMWGLVLL